MSGIRGKSRFNRWWCAACALFAAVALMQHASAQEHSPLSPLPQGEGKGVRATDMLPAADEVAPASASAVQQADGKIEQTSCSSCSGGLIGSPVPSMGGCASCGGCGNGNCCYPGREPCDCCMDQRNIFGRVFGGLYECICCPDPCYESKWRVLADAAYFADNPRPQTQMRLRVGVWDNFEFPDKAEFLWARINGKGPRDPSGNRRGVQEVDLSALRMYVEGATGMIGVFVETNYLHFEPDAPFASTSGFGDLVVGTKTLLLDCELVEAAFQFKTFIPTGNFNKGIGDGHTSLEPSLLLALKLAPETFLQTQLAYNFPIGGTQSAGNTPGVQGPFFHYHLSLNHLLWHCGHGIEVVGVAELGGYEICGGSYTDPLTGRLLPARDVGHVLNAGPGIRVNICDKIDFGVGTQFAITNDNFGEQQFHFDFRWRF